GHRGRQQAPAGAEASARFTHPRYGARPTRSSTLGGKFAYRICGTPAGDRPGHGEGGGRETLRPVAKALAATGVSRAAITPRLTTRPTTAAPGRAPPRRTMFVRVLSPSTTNPPNRAHGRRRVNPTVMTITATPASSTTTPAPRSRAPFIPIPSRRILRPRPTRTSPISTLN